MFSFVRLIFIVRMLAHDRFLKREVRRDLGEYFAEKLGYVRSVGTAHYVRMQPVDDIDKFLMLVIDIGYAGFKFLPPFNE